MKTSNEHSFGGSAAFPVEQTSAKGEETLASKLRASLAQPLVFPGSILALAGAWAVSAPALVLAGIWTIVAASGLAQGRARTERSGQPAQSFSLALPDETPAFRLSEGTGFTPETAAARAIAAATDELESVIEEMLGTGPGAVYRLGRLVAAQGHGVQACTLYGEQMVMDAQALADGGQIWRVLPRSKAPELPDTGTGAAATPSMDDLPVAIARLDAEGKIRMINASARRLLGPDVAEGDPISDILEGLGKTLPDRIRETLAGRAQGRSEVARGLAPDTDGFYQVTMSRVPTGDGTVQEVLAVLSDATELKTLEAQFVQSQKMQAVGQLAGGIAHDFNNLLTAINGHCDLLLLRHLQGDTDHADLIQIRQNANRAAALVRQLLAFSRKQTLRPQILNLYDTLSELANLLNRLLGEKVDLKICNTEDIWPVRIDERQLEQVIVNLVVNARDAMPTGGEVVLSTHKITLDLPLERDRAVVPAGDYCLIEVEDTGTGIAPDKIAKVFEPFFTTKKVGEGTGLGLSTAYGIIKQMDGFIFVDSTVGVGTRFRIYLPAYVPEAGEVQPETTDRVETPRFRDPTGSGVVLLVEDEAPVRAFAARALQMRGYTVLEADSGEAALEILQDPDLKVDLFVSDVVMPGLDGPSWVREAYKVRDNASTVFISGYSEVMVNDGTGAVPRSSYLAKPFALTDLIDRVRDHMDRYVV